MSAAPAYAGQVTVDSLPIGADGSTPLRVNWARMDDARIAGYTVYRSENSIDFAPIGQVLVTPGAEQPAIHTLIDPTPADGTKYWYRIRPFMTSTMPNGSVGVEHLATTNKASQVTPLPMPDNFVMAFNPSNTFHFAWDDRSANETRFEFQRARDPNFATGVRTFTLAANAEATVDVPTAGGTHYWRVRAANGQQFSAYTLPLSGTPFPDNHAPVIGGSPPASLRVSPLDGYPSTLKLAATIRDFHPTSPDHPNDFQGEAYDYYAIEGLVADGLGVDGTPQLSQSPWPSGRGFIGGADGFHHWFHDVPGENLSTTIAMPFDLVGTDTGTPIYRFEQGSFLPINGRLFGNENPVPGGGSVNGNFTLEAHTEFTYRANPSNPPRFNFTGDDDL